MDFEMKKIKQIKKELSLSNGDIAKAAGYANTNSYTTSNGRKKIDGVIEWFHSIFLEREKKNIDYIISIRKALELPQHVSILEEILRLKVREEEKDG